MKMVFLGFDFICPNKGCEALSYSFLNIIKKYSHDKRIEIYNVTYKDFIGDIEQEYKEFTFINWRIHFKSIKYIIETIKLFKSADIIFDITYGDSFSDIYGKRWLFKTNLHKWLAEKVNDNFILLPQTYGPYDNKLLKKCSLQIIKRAKSVYSRDFESIKYLEQNNISNVKLTTDLAMALPYDKDMYKQFFSDSEEIKIGFNVSSLLWENGFTGKNEFGLTVDYQVYCRKIIEYALSEGYGVYLIPHVIDYSDNAPENDWRAINTLKKEYSSVNVPEEFKNPMAIKSFIANMDIFIGARMHSTIAAFSSLVPVIPFSYSRKFEGLYNNLAYPYVINGNVMTTSDAINRTIEYIRKRDRLKENELNAMAKMNSFLEEFEDLLKNDLNC